MAAALRGRRQVSLIAEFKRRSPSLGDIAPEMNLHTQLQAYLDAGAAACSILTEPEFFGGSLEDLRQARRDFPELPLLMKDFVVDARQIGHAAAAGASAVLLIVRCLGAEQLRELHAAARDHGLDCLVECHDADEVETALGLDEALVGINNRDLDRLDLDHDLAKRLLPAVPEGRIGVAESGYSAPAELRGLHGLADAVLIGSALMRGGDAQAFAQACRGEGAR